MMILEGIFELFLRRIIIEIFGYYTLYGVFKVFKHSKGIEWLNNLEEGDELDALGNGCAITIVGLISFCIFGVLLAYTLNFIFK